LGPQQKVAGNSGLGNSAHSTNKEFGMKERSALPQRIFSIQGILCLVIALTVSMPPAAVAQTAASSSQEEAKQPSTGEEELEPLPLSPIEKAEKNGTAIYLSERDIIKLALENNIDVAVDNLNDLSSKASLYGAYGNYDPTLGATMRYNSSKSPNTSTTEASSEGFITSKTFSYDTTFRKNIQTGGNVNATMSTTRSTDDRNINFYSSNYNGNASVSFSQPLWRNLLIDSSRASIKIRKLDLQTTDSQFRRNLTTSISRIQQQYWDFISAIKNYDIQRNSLKLAQKNLSDIRKKVEVGTLAPIEITQARYQVAQTKLSLITAEDTIHRQMNTLRQYISKDRNNDIWSKVIVPTDTPEFREYKIDRETAIATALKNRPEIEQSDLALKKSDINLKLNRNAKKWGVDFTASYGARASTGAPKPEYVAILGEGGGLGTLYSDMFSDMFTGGLTNWSVSVSVDIPLWTRNEDVSIANELINRRKTVLQRNKTEQQIQVDIRNAVQAIETNRQQVETAKLNKELAQEQLDGENKRFEAGLSEFYRVLDQQNRYADAENRELSAIISYTKSIISLQESMNTLLQNDDIQVAKSASEHIPELKLFE
jgi:outer membrane protein